MSLNPFYYTTHTLSPHTLHGVASSNSFILAIDTGICSVFSLFSVIFASIFSVVIFSSFFSIFSPISSSTSFIFFSCSLTYMFFRPIHKKKRINQHTNSTNGTCCDISYLQNNVNNIVLCLCLCCIWCLFVLHLVFVFFTLLRRTVI
jgi:hypothetical protein